MRLLTSSYLWAEPWHKYDQRSRLTGWRTASYAAPRWPRPQDQRGRGLVYCCFRSKVSERMCYEHFKIIVYVCRYGPYLSRVFLLRQLWIVNYYIKSSPNNLSYISYSQRNDILKTVHFGILINFYLEDNRNTSVYVVITDINA